MQIRHMPMHMVTNTMLKMATPVVMPMRITVDG
jgi:hypothetical protein